MWAGRKLPQGLGSPWLRPVSTADTISSLLCSPPGAGEVARNGAHTVGDPSALRKILKSSANVWKEPEEEGRGGLDRSELPGPRCPDGGLDVPETPQEWAKAGCELGSRVWGWKPQPTLGNETPGVTSTSGSVQPPALGLSQTLDPCPPEQDRMVSECLPALSDQPWWVLIQSLGQAVL